jgi:hypothetical protein
MTMMLSSRSSGERTPPPRSLLRRPPICKDLFLNAVEDEAAAAPSPRNLRVWASRPVSLY